MRDLIDHVEKLGRPFDLTMTRNPDFPMKSVANLRFTATRDDEVIAIADVIHESGETKLDTIWVRKDMRRQGIGKALFQAVEQRLGQPMAHSHRLSKDGEAFARSFGPIDHAFDRIDWSGAFDRKFRKKRFEKQNR